MHQTRPSRKGSPPQPPSTPGRVGPEPVRRLGAEEVDTGIAVVGSAGHRQLVVQAHDRQTGGHDVKDYSWPGVRHARNLAIRALPRAAAGAMVVVAAGSGARRADRARSEPGVPALPNWLPFVVLLPVAALVLSVARQDRSARGRRSAGRGDRIVGRRGAPAGQCHLPHAEVPRSAKSAALGRQLDPAAYVVHRAWVGPMVLLVLDDPDDPTPYWLVSCRHPTAYWPRCAT